jgi:hypothetical protein
MCLTLMFVASTKNFLMPLVFSNIISNIFNPQSFGATYCPKEKISCITYAPSVFNALFQHLVIVCWHFVVPWWHSCLLVIPHFVSSMTLVECVIVADQAQIILKPKHPIIWVKCMLNWEARFVSSHLCSS